MKGTVREKKRWKEEQRKQSRERGNFLYQLRLKEGMTLREAAAEIGINKSTLCRYEQGLILSMSEAVRQGVCRVYRISDRELDEGRRLAEVRPEIANPEDEKRRRIREHLLEEEDFLRLYRTLDDRSKLRIQFLAGAFNGV